VPVKNTSSEDILSVFTSCLQPGKIQYRLKLLVEFKAAIPKKSKDFLGKAGQKKLAKGMDDTQETTPVVSREAENTSSGKLQKTCGNRKEEANGCSEWTAESYCCKRQ